MVAGFLPVSFVQAHHAYISFSTLRCRAWARTRTGSERRGCAQTCTGLCLQQIQCRATGLHRSMVWYTRRMGGPAAQCYGVRFRTTRCSRLRWGELPDLRLAASGSPLVGPITDVNGKFSWWICRGSEHSAGDCFGRWRRQLVIPGTTACRILRCQTFAVMPQNRSRATFQDLPIATGSGTRWSASC